MPTNTSTSDARWVILPDFCRQHEDASLLLLAHHEIFMAGFVCLFVCAKPRSVTVQVPPSPSTAFFFFYSTPWSAQAVQVTTSWCKNVSLSWTQASFPHLHYTEIHDLSLGFSPLSHKSSEIVIFSVTKAIQPFLEAFIARFYIEQHNPPFSRCIWHSSQSLVTIPYKFWE